MCGKVIWLFISFLRMCIIRRVVLLGFLFFPESNFVFSVWSSGVVMGHLELLRLTFCLSIMRASSRSSFFDLHVQFRIE